MLTVKTPVKSKVVMVWRKTKVEVFNLMTFLDVTLEKQKYVYIL